MRFASVFVAYIFVTSLRVVCASPQAPASHTANYGHLSSAMRGAITTYLLDSQESEHPQYCPYKIVKSDVQGQCAFVSLSYRGYGDGLLHEDIVLWKPKAHKLGEQNEQNSGWGAAAPHDVRLNEIPPNLW